MRSPEVRALLRESEHLMRVIDEVAPSTFERDLEAAIDHALQSACPGLNRQDYYADSGDPQYWGCGCTTREGVRECYEAYLYVVRTNITEFECSPFAEYAVDGTNLEKNVRLFPDLYGKLVVDGREE